MLFAIISEDVPDSLPLRQSARAAHLARLELLNNEKRLILAGPHPGSENDEAITFTGSLVVADFNSLEAAETWAEADPYVTAGVYARVTVKPFKKVLP